MEKPILATTLAGLFIKKKAWSNAHILWYKEAAKKLNDSSLNELSKKRGYSEGVDEVMKRLYPKSSDSERTVIARRMFFDSVVKNIQENLNLKNEGIIKYFLKLKKKFRLALITTNTNEALNKILSKTNLQDFFDIIEASEESEKDNKIIVFERFIKKYNKPVIYIGGDRKDSFDYCKNNNIKCIFANLEAEEEIKGVESVHNLQELKEKLNLLFNFSPIFQL